MIHKRLFLFVLYLSFFSLGAQVTEVGNRKQFDKILNRYDVVVAYVYTSQVDGEYEVFEEMSYNKKFSYPYIKFISVPLDEALQEDYLVEENSILIFKNGKLYASEYYTGYFDSNDVESYLENYLSILIKTYENNQENIERTITYVKDTPRISFGFGYPYYDEYYYPGYWHRYGWHSPFGTWGYHRHSRHHHPHFGISFGV